MRAVTSTILFIAAAMAANPALSTVVIAEPARQPTVCFESAGPCESAATPVVVPAQSTNSELPAPLVPAIVGVLALGLAFVRRTGGMPEVVC